MARRYADEDMSTALSFAAIRAVETFDPMRHHDLDARIYVCLRHRAYAWHRNKTKQALFEEAAAQWSLDAPPLGLRGADAAPLVEMLTDDREPDPADELERKERRAAVLSALPRRLADIAALYMDGLTMAEIGRMYEISRERVRQILARAVRLARRNLGIAK